MHCRPTSHNQLIHTFLVLLFAVNQLGYCFAVDQRICKHSTDCPESQCCAETPIGNKMCIDYEKRGDICLYRTRTPVSCHFTNNILRAVLPKQTCGCAPGLKCVSTTPMEAGVWNHDFVCARVRPFQHYKLNPFLVDSNDVE